MSKSVDSGTLMEFNQYKSAGISSPKRNILFFTLLRGGDFAQNP